MITPSVLCSCCGHGDSPSASIYASCAELWHILLQKDIKVALNVIWLFGPWSGSRKSDNQFSPTFGSGLNRSVLLFTLSKSQFRSHLDSGHNYVRASRASSHRRLWADSKAPSVASPADVSGLARSRPSSELRPPLWAAAPSHVGDTAPSYCVVQTEIEKQRGKML